MARRPLPRILVNGNAQIAKSRELARTAADSATDVLHPLITVTVDCAGWQPPDGASGPPRPRTGADHCCSWWPP